MIENRVDIFITAYLRDKYTQQTLWYLRNRTKYPHNTILIDNGRNSYFEDLTNLVITPNRNIGIHAAWNIALSLAETKYFITSDNDIYVPKLDPDWLTQMVNFMEERPDYGAISLHPHIFIGAAGIDPADPEDVKERNMCGAVMRIMRTEMVREVGGWEHKTDPKRNHEERTICSRLQSAGYRTGIASRIRAYHPFGRDTGGNWGYPPEITPEMQGHTPELKDYVLQFDQPDSYDKDTWLPKT